MINIFNRQGAGRFRAQVFAFFAGALFLVSAGVFFVRTNHDLGERTADAERDIGLRAMLVENLIRQAMIGPRLVISGQVDSIDLARLEDTAALVFKINGAISGLEVAAKGKPSIYFNRQSNVVRANVLNAESVATPRSAGSGVKGVLDRRGDPFVSIDSEFLIITQAVSVRREGGKTEFWGHVSATAKLAEIANAMQLGVLARQGYAVDLEYFVRGSSEGKPLFFTGSALNDALFKHEIHLPQGDKILLRASPPVSWDVPAAKLPELLLLLAGSCLVGLLTYLLLRRPAEMGEQVALRTLQLSLDKEVLESEVDRRRQTEQLLQNSHALLDSIFEHIPSMVVLKRAADLKIVRVNRVGEEVLGRTKDSLIGRSSSELFQSEQAQRDSDSDLAAIHEGTLIDLPEQFIQMPGGTERWMKIKKLALFDGDGKPAHVLEIGEDITTHKHLDQAITENLNFVKQLMAAIPAPVFFTDASGSYIGVNRAFESFYGTDADSLIGQTVYDIAPRQFVEMYDKACRSLLESGSDQSYESRVTCADGIEKDVVFYMAVFSTLQSEIGGIVGVILDITEQKAAARHVLRLNRALAVVSEANQAILLATDSYSLIHKAVNILHQTGGFPLAWVYSNVDHLPAMVVIGKEPEFATIATAALRSKADQQQREGESVELGRCDFFGAISDCDEALAESLDCFVGHGFAHLPLQIEGRSIGGICIVGLAEDLLDEKEQTLLVGLAENLSHAIGTLQQENARQMAERKLELASHVFENSAEGVMITDNSNKILMVNRRFSEITGYSAEEVTGKTPSMLNSGLQDKSFYNNMWRSLENRGEWHGEIHNRRKDGEIIVEWLNISSVKNEDGEIINFVAVFSEITVHKTIKKRMQFLTHYDALTSLPNRILFSDRFEQLIIAARRNKRSTALLLIDLDHFDKINKTMGHSTGDMLLQEVATRLLAAVGEGGCVSRLGGDEFAIVLSDIETPDEVAASANRIQRELGRSLYLGGTELNVSASIGISVFPRDGEDTETLTKSADAAMYLAAEAGGNTYRFPQANEHLAEQIRLRDRLHRAIERDELKVYFQPLVSGETGKIVGAEALLRWFRPEAGFISPEIFVPMMEEAGLAVKLGDWVLRTAMAHNIEWRSEIDKDLFVVVNFCSGQIADERAVEKVDEALKSLAFEPRYLHLEMSETTLMDDAPTGLAFLHELKDLGVTLSIDNFGTGYSSLSYLNRFPINTLKIHRSFIQDTPNDAEAAAITRTIIAMGHSLNLTIVAEGVETASQVNFLRRSRCDLLQGYRFSPAVSAEEFSMLLKESRETGSMFPDPGESDRLHLVG